MRKRTSLVSEGSGKILIALVLVALLTLPLFGLTSRYSAFAPAKEVALLQSKDLKQRASVLCTALGTANPIIGEPQFIVQKLNPKGRRGERRLWVVDCLAGVHVYTMIFNDLTGNIESVYSDGLSVSNSVAYASGLAVTSSAAAVEGGERRLKDLQMAPKGTRIALTQQPECDRDGITWRMTWKVLRPEAVRPYEVRMVLNGCDATPLMVVDCRELEHYAPR